jgi:DNA-binding winged helix-turn-helix (wHTH) protein
MISAADGRLRSGPVELDITRRHVRFDGVPIALSGLPFRILEQLVRSGGRIVTRQELKQVLWPYAERIDTEHRLNTAIRGLREALGDGGSRRRLILTVRGHGYRWVGGERVTSRRPLVRLAAAAALALTFVSASLLRREGDPGDNNPTNVASARTLAWTYVNQGRPSAALPQIATLLQASDRSPEGQAEVGWLLLRSGTPTAALAACSGQAETSINLLSCRQTALGRLGLISDARAVGVRIMRMANAAPRSVQSVADAPAALGYSRFLRWRISTFVRPGRDWFQRAQLQAEAGLYSDALASLRRAAAVHDPLLAKIRSTTEFAPLEQSRDFRRISAAVFSAELS